MPEKLSTSTIANSQPSREIEIRARSGDDEAYELRRLAAVGPFIDTYRDFKAAVERTAHDNSDAGTDGLDELLLLARNSEHETYVNGEARTLNETDEALIEHMQIKTENLEARHAVDMDAFLPTQGAEETMEYVLSSLEQRLHDAVQANDAEKIEFYANQVDAFEMLMSTINDDGTVKLPVEGVAHNYVVQSEYVMSEPDDEDGIAVLADDKKALDEANTFYQMTTEAYKAVAEFYPHDEQVAAVHGNETSVAHAEQDNDKVELAQPSLEQRIGEKVVQEVVDRTPAHERDASDKSSQEAISVVEDVESTTDRPAHEVARAELVDVDARPQTEALDDVVNGDNYEMKLQKAEQEIADITNKLSHATSRMRKKRLRRALSRRQKYIQTFTQRAA